MRFTLRDIFWGILVMLCLLHLFATSLKCRQEKLRAERWRSRCGSLEDVFVQEGWKVTWPTTALGEWVLIEKDRRSYCNQHGFADPSLKD